MFLFFNLFFLNAQRYVEYASEKCDSMVLISKKDLNTINKVFNENYKLDSLNKVNDKLIEKLELKNTALDSILMKQSRVISNQEIRIKVLEKNYQISRQEFDKELKKEKVKTISFQTTTGLSLMAIIIILLI